MTTWRALRDAINEMSETQLDRPARFAHISYGELLVKDLALGKFPKSHVDYCQPPGILQEGDFYLK
jgi:hypothetical protein